ncbi:MAG: hypothetical protein Q4A82_05965 [Corynebacterium sp.]|nr:hypothetical protein [Corynebacterium sp.]
MHIPIVIVPLVAVGLILWVLVPKLGQWLQYWLMGFGLIGFLGTYWSKVTGETMLKEIGLSVEHPGSVAQHMFWGNAMVAVSLALFFSTVLMWWVSLTTRSFWYVTLSQILCVLVGVGAILVTTITGHAGAQLVWG